MNIHSLEVKYLKNKKISRIRSCIRLDGQYEITKKKLKGYLED